MAHILLINITNTSYSNNTNTDASCIYANGMLRLNDNGWLWSVDVGPGALSQDTIGMAKAMVSVNAKLCQLQFPMGNKVRNAIHININSRQSIH